MAHIKFAETDKTFKSMPKLWASATQEAEEKCPVSIVINKSTGKITFNRKVVTGEWVVLHGSQGAYDALNVTDGKVTINITPVYSRSDPTALIGYRGYFAAGKKVDTAKLHSSLLPPARQDDYNPLDDEPF